VPGTRDNDFGDVIEIHGLGLIFGPSPIGFQEFAGLGMDDKSFRFIGHRDGHSNAPA
jgi:hypothetical protein